MSRPVLSITFAAMLSTTAAMAQAPAAPALSGLTTVVLPPEVTFPEGIAYDASSNAIFTASAATGTLVRVDLKSGGSRNRRARRCPRAQGRDDVSGSPGDEARS